MIVLDASLIIDAILPKLGERHEKAKEVIKVVSEHGYTVYLPRIARIELLSVLSRKLGRKVIDIVEELGEGVVFVGEEKFYQIAETLAPKIQGRAVDLYYISLAYKISSLLLSCDKLQVENAKKAGVEAYYIPEEFEKVIKRLKEGKQI